MKKILLTTFILSSYICSAQQSSPSKKETVDYLVSKILAYGDGIKNVWFDEENCKLTIEYSLEKSSEKFETTDKAFYAGSRFPCDKSTVVISQNISSLNANSIAWELDKAVLTMQIGARNGFYGDKRTANCVGLSDMLPNVENRGFTRIVFTTSKVADDPKFQDKIKNAYSRLIALCGGVPLQDDPFDR